MCVWRTGSQSVKWEILSKRDKKWKSGLNLKMSTTAASLRIGGRIFNVCAFCRLADFTQLFALSSAVSLALSLLVTRPWRALARRCLLTWHTHPGLSQLWGIQIEKKEKTHSQPDHIHMLIGVQLQGTKKPRKNVNFNAVSPQWINLEN